MTTYKIIRMFQEDRTARIIKTGLTLEEAQAHCQDPETSSSTATSERARMVTEDCGPWFDGYEEERRPRAWPEPPESSHGAAR